MACEVCCLYLRFDRCVVHSRVATTTVAAAAKCRCLGALLSATASSMCPREVRSQGPSWARRAGRSASCGLPGNVVCGARLEVSGRDAGSRSLLRCLVDKDSEGEGCSLAAASSSAPVASHHCTPTCCLSTCLWCSDQQSRTLIETFAVCDETRVCCVEKRNVNEQTNFTISAHCVNEDVRTCFSCSHGLLVIKFFSWLYLFADASEFENLLHNRKICHRSTFLPLGWSKGFCMVGASE